MTVPVSCGSSFRFISFQNAASKVHRTSKLCYSVFRQTQVRDSVRAGVCTNTKSTPTVFDQTALRNPLHPGLCEHLAAAARCPPRIHRLYTASTRAHQTEDLHTGPRTEYQYGKEHYGNARLALSRWGPRKVYIFF